MPSTDEIASEVRSLAPWYHNVELVPGIWTNPEGHRWPADYPASRWKLIEPLLPKDLTHVHALDVGCNSGFFCRELARRGCRSVVGIDVDNRALEQARLVRATSGVWFVLDKIAVYDVCALARRFDLVLFLGVLYHLRHPLLALERLREVTAGSLIVQCNVHGEDAADDVPDRIPLADLDDVLDKNGFPACYFIEKSVGYNDASTWWIPNPGCLAAMLRTAGFAVCRQSDSILVCT